MRNADGGSIDLASWLSLRFERGTRYYARRGRSLMTWPGSFETGLSALAASAKRRRQRGYDLVA